MITATDELRDLDKGIAGAEIAMHHREFYAAFNACSAHLGHDTLAAQREEEFKKLPQEQQDEMTRKRDFGIYGVFGLYNGSQNPEVPLALSIVRSEKTGEGLKGKYRTALQDPTMQKKITDRFPAITPERIALVLGYPLASL